jgi:hypothetical protein
LTVDFWAWSAGVAGLALAFGARRFAASPLLVIYCVVWVISMPLDIAFLWQDGGLSLTPSLTLALPSESTAIALLTAWAVAIAATCTCVWFGQVVAVPRHLAHLIRSVTFDRSGVRKARLRAAALLLVLLLVPIALRVGSVGVREFSSLRQSALGDSLLDSAGFQFAPVAALLLFVLGLEFPSARPWSWMAAVLASGLALAVGSRSGFLLSASLPAVHYTLLWWRRTHGRQIPWLRVGGVAAALLLGLLAYTQWARGSQHVNFSAGYGSSEVSAADSTLAIMSTPDPPQENTFLAAILFPVPRATWPDKPDSGNVVASKALAPARYADTSAEIAIPVLAESWIGFRSWGAVVTAAIIGSYVLVSEGFKLAGRQNPFLYSAYLLLAYRGVNLFRGDLLNVLVPGFFGVAGCLLVARLVDLESGTRTRHRGEVPE